MKYPKQKWLDKKSNKPNRKKLIQKTSVLWSRIIKTHGRCAICSSISSVDAHHIVRKGKAIHPGWFLLENGIPLCVDCHRDGIHSMHYPTTRVFQKKINTWLNKKDLTYEVLYSMCHTTQRMDIFTIQDIYSALRIVASQLGQASP